MQARFLLTVVACASLGVHAALAQPASPVTFARHIAPIVFTRCAPCHHEGGPGPFELTSYATVKQRATLIASVVKKRLMPPWKAEPGYGGEFVGQYPLTAGEIDLIQRWVEAGAPEGDARDLPALPKWTSGWQLGQPDQVLTFAEPYILPAEGTDVLRIFVVPIPLGAKRWVKGLEFRPGNPRVVHHANIRIDRTTRSRELDERDPAPGSDGLMANSAVYPDGHFLGWAPGQVAPLLPKGLAWTLDPGTDLVVELHMQPTGKPETVAPSFGFYYTNDPPDRTPAMLRLGRQDIDIPAGTSDYTITDSYTLPVDAEVHAVQPHAHYRAREIRGTATLPDGSTRWLIFIKDWDFRWQHVFRYVKPIALPRGTTLTMRYTYDNSAANPRNPQRPPERTYWGQRSSDEMGNLWIQLQPRNDRDLETLNADFRPKAARDDTAGYEMMLRRDPLNIAYHNDAALLYLELNRPALAVAHFASAAELQPQSAMACFNLGAALARAGRADEAVAAYGDAIRLKPDYAAAHNNLGNTVAALGRLDEAAGHYADALRIDARDATTHNNFGVTLEALGRTGDALRQFQDAIGLDAEYAEPRYNLGRALAAGGSLTSGVEQLRRAASLRPDWVPALAELARWLAIADEPLRDPREAVRLAERAAALSGRRDPVVLDVLAMAYAARGQFDRAIATAQSALDADPKAAGAAAVAARLELYKQRQPYRHPR